MASTPESRRPLLTVRLRGHDHAWTLAGSGDARGIVPEGFSASSDRSGPVSCGFNLKRDPALSWADLPPFAELEAEVGGVLVWGGRVWETPSTRGDERALSVTGRGGSSHLEDDVFWRTYAHSRLTDWRDHRSFLAADLGSATANGVVTGGGQGVTVIGWSAGAEVAHGQMAAITLDLGPQNLAKRIVIEFDKVNADNFATVVARSHANVNMLVGDFSEAIATGFGTITSPAAGTFSTGYRYVSVYIIRTDSNTSVLNDDELLRLSRIQVYTDTDWESGNASNLKASDVILDARQHAPLLAETDERITASSFSIPHLATEGYQSPRQVMDAANAYHNWNLGVDARGRLFFEPRPTAPLYEVGAWSGYEFSDQSTGSAEDVYNRVIVQGTDAEGAPLHVARYPADTAPLTELVDTGGVTNPSFETNTTGWTSGGSFGSIARTTGDSYEGSAALTLTHEADTSFGGTYTDVSGLSPGEPYTIRYAIKWVASVTSPARAAFLRVLEGVGDTVLASHQADAADITSWTFRALSFTAPTGGQVRLFFGASNYSTPDEATIRLDAVRVYQGKPGPLERLGLRRTKIIQVGAVLNQSSAEAIGDVWLSEHSRTLFKGSLKVTGMGAVRTVLGGRPVHPSELLLAPGQRIRFTDMLDPDTGAQGRDGDIAAVSYDHDGESASISIDSERGRLDALLQRIGALQSVAT